ncbi:bromodomain-containing protein 8 [Cryptococcus neoformans Tu259-1]|uniref:Bromodomain-containing protein 8 n=1 Tax=Cryptococcus neoformans Tu259-1 TaxID=1230072 RepID=A0A854Q8H2_CRYNE|nr:bromodomain-containing protein 8 [Cryptococcus neoformans var. grubii AD1-83a]OXG15838.1 bromodomain-containing protein 8 [Cryptococcus neoformans var. grubii Tu259-1]OXG53809.1 bromodomain-containing protein 8 [Cryptococcus neoformans var. grubii MW-RSA1955]OXG56978.1 bromodomain-containing protein 8 [Cryptococcus neoformans var. grubii CHC193]OXG60589.1 bromodomain-containing protein 8 [Cryptococcus neoformans var. grubii c8]OXH06414.1 bromodomain-containing protein 8 [Cryptococcus neofor
MSSQTPLSDPLTTQEKLLLSQAVYKLGAFSWAEVSSLLLDHPCIKDATPHARPAKLFTPERCEGIYKELMGAIGINVPAPDGIKPHAKSHLRLAQNYYIARLTELQNEISLYETRFTSLMSEITALKKGELDEQMREEIKAGLERKYGKKAVEEWMPGNVEIQKAVEDGPVKEGEVDPELATREEEKEKKQKDVEEPGEDVEMVDASTSEENPVVSVLGKQDGLSKSLKPEVVETEVEKPIEQVKTPNATGAALSPQASPLSPAPSDNSPSRSVKTAADEEKEEEDVEKEEEKGEEEEEEVVPGKKTNKRKAISQPKGAPPTKRNSRRGAVTEEPEGSEAGEAEEEEEEGAEEKEEGPPTTRGRRSKRSSLTKPSASPSLPPKDTSPAISRRAPSVSSTTSAATPGGEGERRSSRRAAAAAAGRRGMRDDVVSKSVRGQTADAADADDGPPTPTAAEEHEPETRKSTRASRRKSGLPEHQQQAAVTPTPVERERRGTRATTRNLRESVENEHASADNDDDNDDHDDDDTTNNNNDDMENPDPDVPIAPTPNSSNKEKGKKSSKPFLFSLLEAMASHRFGTIFESPVRKSDAPDYYSVIKKPMDLKTIKGKIKDGRIERIDELERDVLLMFSNAMMYNAPDSQVYEMAKEMMKDCEGHFAHFRNMEMELENEG